MLGKPHPRRPQGASGSGMQPFLDEIRWTMNLENRVKIRLD